MGAIVNNRKHTICLFAAVMLSPQRSDGWSHFQIAVSVVLFQVAFKVVFLLLCRLVLVQRELKAKHGLEGIGEDVVHGGDEGDDHRRALPVILIVRAALVGSVEAFEPGALGGGHPGEEEEDDHGPEGADDAHPSLGEAAEGEDGGNEDTPPDHKLAKVVAAGGEERERGGGWGEGSG